MAQPNPTTTATNPRIAKLIELEVAGRIKPEHQTELDTYRAQGIAPKRASDPGTEGERKASAFLTRALGANRSYTETGVGPRSLVGQAMADNAPDLLNSLPSFIGNSDKRQVSDTAQDEFIAASLRQDSGAAIPDAELERQRRIYFPMPGDGEAVIEQKRQARLRAIDGLVQSSGRLITPKQREMLESMRGEIDSAVAGDGDDKGTLVTTEVANKLNEGGLSADQKAAYDAFNKANPNATAEQLRAFATSIGWGLANADDIVKARDAGGGVMPGETAIIRDPDISDVRGKGGIVEGADAVVRGGADTLSLGFSDELSAAGDTLFRGGTMDDNLRRQRAIDRYDAENSPWLRGAGQLTGGLVMPLGAGARTTGELIRSGATLGGLYGVGSGEGWQDRGIKGVTGTVAGAATGAAFGKLGDIWRRRGGGGNGGGPTPPAPDDILDVSGRMGINPSPATVGGRASEIAQLGLGNAPGSMGPVRNAVEAETQGLADFARGTAARMGRVGTPQEAGEIISRGARVADRAQAREAGAAYNSRTAMMGGEGAPVTMGGTQTAIRNVANDFASNDVVSDLLTHPLVRRIQGADAGELTLGESTELLSEARRVLRRARETKQPGRLVSQLAGLEGAIEADVVRAAQASDAIAGRASAEGAVAAQRRGDSLWADRMQAQRQELKKPLASFTDDVNTSSESVYRQLFNDMKEEGGNLIRLRRTLDRLPRRARDAFSATAFDDLGKAVPSAQNAAGDAWSFETFMTNWGKASPEARRLVFQGRGVDREVGDIVRYAERLREVNRSRNFSGTAAAASNASYATALVTSLFGGPGTAATVAAAYPAMNIAGRAFMATPAARSWLRSAMRGAIRGNDSQVRTLVRRLPSLAANNPAISGEVRQLEQAIISAANDNAPRVAAASEGQQEDR